MIYEAVYLQYRTVLAPTQPTLSTPLISLPPSRPPSLFKTKLKTSTCNEILHACPRDLSCSRRGRVTTHYGFHTNHIPAAASPNELERGRCCEGSCWICPGSGPYVQLLPRPIRSYDVVQYYKRTSSAAARVSRCALCSFYLRGSCLGAVPAARTDMQIGAAFVYQEVRRYIGILT